MLLAVCEPEAVGDEEEAPFVCGMELEDMMMKVGSGAEGVVWRGGKTGRRVQTTAPSYTRIKSFLDDRRLDQ